MRLTVCLILILVSALANAQTAPRIELKKNQIGSVYLGESVSAALKSYDPEFTVFNESQFIPSVKDMFIATENETPMAIVGDFNGDKAKDVIVMGRARKELLILAVLSSQNGFKVNELERSPLDSEPSLYPPMVHDDAEYDEDESSILREQGLYRYLTLIPARAAVGTGIKVRTFSTDSVQIEYFQGDARLFYFHKNSFRELKGH